MRNIAQLVKKIPKILGLGVLGTALYGLVSCASLQNMTDAEKMALAGNALLTTSYNSDNEKYARGAAVLGSSLSLLGDMKYGKELAELDQITINNNLNLVREQEGNLNENKKEYDSKEFLRDLDYETRGELVKELKNIDRTSRTFEEKKSLDNLLSVVNSTPTGFFMYEKWVDFDGNEKANFDEHINLNESVYDLRDLDSLIFAFYGGDSHSYDGEITVKVWDMENGEFLHSSSQQYDNSKIGCFNHKSRGFEKSGKYRVVLNTANNENFYLDFEVIK